MDCLRVGRTQLARFYPGAPGVTTPVRWFRCQPGAQIFPYPHAFGFNVYDDPEVKEGRVIGFTPALGTWDSGLNHGEAGQHFHGPAAWFLSGIPLSAMGQDARCLQWAGLYRPAVGLLAVAGASADVGAASLAVKAVFTENTPSTGVLLALAAGWVDLTQPAPAALALAAAFVELLAPARPAVVALSAGYAAAESGRAQLAMACEWAPGEGNYAAAVGLAAAFVEQLAGEAAALNLAVSWSENVTVQLTRADGQALPLAPGQTATVVWNIPTYDTIPLFGGTAPQSEFQAPASGVYLFGWIYVVARANTGDPPQHFQMRFQRNGAAYAPTFDFSTDDPRNPYGYWATGFFSQVELTALDVLAVEVQNLEATGTTPSLYVTMMVQYLGVPVLPATPAALEP